MGKLNGPFRDIIPILFKMKKSTGYKYNSIKDYIELDNFLYKYGITKISQEIYNVAVIKEENPYLKKKRYYSLENLTSHFIIFFYNILTNKNPNDQRN